MPISPEAHSTRIALCDPAYKVNDVPSKAKTKTICNAKTQQVPSQHRNNSRNERDPCNKHQVDAYPAVRNMRLNYVTSIEEGVRLNKYPMISGEPKMSRKVNQESQVSFLSRYGRAIGVKDSSVRISPIPRLLPAHDLFDPLQRRPTDLSHL